ncbi:GNAT family N-acetyltransferase [Paenibacillus sp. MMS20-IR301]|uniref:GNAT family N-acetyltransferase n=1 Tax=Paenibacillus sp. MMS20-IR301 TaxID=2895946 RepID=UPI0028EA3D12|nr:GNAT family N-acetyltransferase [Paenibacillus sp. MMS20-IR301]WNS43379.1 GNAT family N-acetyltransferase [Paenibacillus sp. MMS20-IR301]
MKLTDNRLDLRPLAAAELALAIENYAELEQTLGLKVTTNGTLLDDEEMQYVMRIRRTKVLQDEKNCPWLTNWAIIHREEQRIIGFLILKGTPNEQGEVIVGYVIDERDWGQGYATEALQGISRWIFSHPEAHWIIADTEKDNIASHRVLQHLGAELYRETEDLLWWRIARPVKAG